jgi:transketolase
VLHVPTIKPFDAEAVSEFASSVDRIVTAENHVVVGGLGSLVAEALFERGIVKPMQRIGLPDRYIECGSVAHLQSVYGLSTDRVIATIAAAA